jgi:hypothetical protein
MNLGVRHHLAAKLTFALVGLVVLTDHPHMRYLTVSSAHAEPGTPPAVGNLPASGNLPAAANPPAAPNPPAAVNPPAAANPRAAAIPPATRNHRAAGSRRLVGKHQAKLTADARPAPQIRSVVSVCVWEGLDWNQMSEDERQAWETLGWSPALWETDNSGGASSSSKDWSELTPKERNAAAWLGYTAQNWEVPCPPVVAGPDEE